MGLSEYLAKNYLTAEKPAKTSKKKRKNKDNSAGLTITDDDALDDRWTKRQALGGDGDEEEEFCRAALGQIGEDDVDSPYVIAGRTTERRTTKANWKTLDSSTEKNSRHHYGDEGEAADAILESTAAERKTKMDITADDEAPVIANDETENRKTEESRQMESGARAGLQTAAETAAFADAQRKREKEESRRIAQEAKRQETVYRDASGRVIDISKKRAEAKRVAEEKETRAREVLMGDAQKREEKAKEEALEQAKFMPVARHADDEEMNREMKETIRWEDPMAEYIANKSQKKHKKKKKRAGSKEEEEEEDLQEIRKPVFTGASAPNRYGIRSGPRWDGVDRGNGFEEKWFAARNQQELDMRLEIDSDID